MNMLEKPLDVVVVGNVGVDTNIYLFGEEIDFSVEANFTQNFDCVGQAGGYASRGFRRLGFSTAFIGSVGEDFNGRYIRETLARDGIDLEGVFIDPAGTSRSVNIMYKDGRRKNFYDGKGHMTLHAPVEISRRIFSSARLAHFNIPNWARQLLPVAKECGLPIAVDLQDVIDINDPYRQDFINAADYLFFSAANQRDPGEIAQELLRRRPELIIIAGMGAQGCLLATSEKGVQYFPAIEMVQPVIDTNGAGDSLAVGFLSSYLLQGLSLDEAIQRGQIAARFCCTQKASSDTLITMNELDHLSGRGGNAISEGNS
jgi:sugar/nucleoside kinase (ribokinase family)